MGKKRKVFPVFLLFAVSLIFMLIAALNTRKTIKRTDRPGSEDMKIICPRLNGCADAFLIYNQFGAMMIDTGEEADGELLLDLLREEGITSLDLLVLTHFDKDHIGGAPAILDQIPVRTCYMPASDEEGDRYERLIAALEAGGTKTVFLTEPADLTRLSASITIYPPLAMTYKESTDNNLSLITSIKYQSTALLFMGDAETERVSEYILNQYDYTKYDFIKIPHHGRDVLTTNYLLYVLDPSDVLITSSREEPENPEVLEKLQAEGVRTWLTRDGTVTMIVSREGLSVSQ